MARERSRFAVPLLARVILALAAVGLIPFLTSAYQIRSGEAAMVDQTQKTHLVSVLATADRVAAHVRLLEGLAAATAANSVLVADPASTAAEELIAGVLRARSDVVAAGIYLDRADRERAARPVVEPVRLARRNDYRRAIDGALESVDARPLAAVPAGEETWLRVRAQVPERPELFVLLLARLTPLEDAIRPDEIGDQTEMVLADRAHRILLGGFGPSATNATVVPGAAGGAGDDPTVDAMATVSPVLLEAAGRTASGVDRYTVENGRQLISAHAAVPGTPWFVLSRQPLAAAARAAAAQRRVARHAFVLVLAVTALIAFGAQRAIVAPIRRLVRAQRRLAGAGADFEDGDGGGEIAQLENAFAQLEENLHDREALSRVFLGRYQVIEVLGVGAMGTVFRGWDPRLERPVALKTVKIGKAAGRADPDDPDSPAAQLVREAITLARLNHPNIVTVFDVLQQGGQAFLAMEVVEGLSLERYLWRQKRLSVGQTVALGRGLLAALEAAHRHGVVHHDVKPANILLGDEGSIKVTDFGISELLSGVHKAQDVVCGTPGYLAPEALRGAGYSPKSDLFGAGAVLYQCLTGRRPFDGKTPREMMVATLVHQPVPVSEVVPEVPRELEALISSMLAKEPDERPRDAAEVAAALARLAPEGEQEWSLSLSPSIDLGDRDEDETRRRPHTALVPTHRIAG